MQPTRDIHSHPETIGPSRAFSVRIPLSIALLSAGFSGVSLAPAPAQIASTTPPAAAASPDTIKQREQELEATRAQQKSSVEAQAKLKAEIAGTEEELKTKRKQLQKFEEARKIFEAS